MEKWHRVKITVVKKYLSDDLIAEYVTDKLKNENYGLCTDFELQQEFFLEKPHKPEGFCSWAWADINREVVAVMGGGNFPWINRDGIAIVSCADGLRPVVFKIERV